MGGGGGGHLLSYPFQHFNSQGIDKLTAGRSELIRKVGIHNYIFDCVSYLIAS